MSRPKRSAKSIERPMAAITFGGRRVYLGRWDTQALVELAIDRAALHFGLDRALRHGARAKRLGPASPEVLKREARLLYKKRSASSPWHGVWVDTRGRIHAQIEVDGVANILGTYESEKEAARDVDSACRYHGLPVLNFPKRVTAAASCDEIRRRRRDARKQATSSRYVGVFYRPGSQSRSWSFLLWTIERQNNTLISGFENEREAALAHDRAALFYGSKTTLNFPREARARGAADFDTIRREVQRERKKAYTSQYRGVCWVKDAWHATIQARGKHRVLGRFTDESAAAAAYDDAVRELYPPELAARKLNFL